jgi:aminomethyltransferase
VLTKIAPDSGWEELNYYWAKDTFVCGIPVFASRTGYTGEDGFELYVPSEQASELWNILIEEGKTRGILPCGLGARDSLRLEMGYPLHGHELSPDITPLQAGLNWAVKLDTVPHFIGREALLQERTEGPQVQLKAFLIQDKRIARHGYEIANLSKQIVGKITSGTFSPHCGLPIALGFVQKESSQSSEYLIKVRNDWIPAKIISLPFVPSRVRKNPK